MYWTIGRQPEDKGLYLCTHEGNIEILYFNGSEWVQEENVVKVDAFRPLPQPYKPATTAGIYDKIDILILRLNILRDLLSYTDDNFNDKITHLLDDTIMNLGAYISVANYKKTKGE